MKAYQGSKNVAWICGLTLTLSSVACGSKKKDDTATTSTSSGGTVSSAGGGGVSTTTASSDLSASAALSTVTSNLTNPAGGIGAIALTTSASLTDNALALTGLSSIWTLPGTFDDGHGDKYDLADYVSGELDANNTKIRGSLERLSEFGPIVCAVDYFLPGKDANGVPGDGSGSITVDFSDAAMNAKCPGIAALAGGSAPQAMLYQVSTPADTSVYTKEYQFGVSSVTENMMFWRNDADGTIAIAYMDNGQASGNGNFGSRTLIHFDPKAHVTRYEYVSRGFDKLGTQNGKSQYIVYRVLVDSANPSAYALIHEGTNDESQYIQVAVAGKMKTGADNIAVSFAGVGQTNADLNGPEFDACIGSQNAIVTDGSLTCSLAGTAASAVTAPDSNLLTRTSLAEYLPTATMDLSFTDGSDLYTAEVP